MSVNFSARKTRNVLVHKFMFADDTAHNHQAAQEIITCFLRSEKSFKLKINLKKTKVIYQPSLGSHDIGQDIQMEDQVLIQVNKLKI